MLFSGLLEHEVQIEPFFTRTANTKRFERLSYSSEGKKFVQGTQHGLGRSKTGPLKR